MQVHDVLMLLTIAGLCLYAVREERRRSAKKKSRKKIADTLKHLRGE